LEALKFRRAVKVLLRPVGVSGKEAPLASICAAVVAARKTSTMTARPWYLAAPSIRGREAISILSIDVVVMRESFEYGCFAFDPECKNGTAYMNPFQMTHTALQVLKMLDASFIQTYFKFFG